MANPSTPPNASASVKTAPVGKAVVLVGCKLPNGLHLEVNGTTVVLKGRAQFLIPNKDRRFKNPEIIEGDSFTIVPRDFAEAWFKAHENYPPVKNNMVYMVENRADAGAVADETRDVKTGLEKLDTTKKSDMGVLKSLSESDKME